MLYNAFSAKSDHYQYIHKLVSHVYVMIVLFLNLRISRNGNLQYTLQANCAMPNGLHKTCYELFTSSMTGPCVCIYSVLVVLAQKPYKELEMRNFTVKSKDDLEF